jgi:nucleoside-diphosphate-sugar epimerase
MAPRSLITGGAGFVGSHLAEELLRRGEEVYVLADLSTCRIDNIEHLKRSSHFHYVIDSVHNELVLAELVDRCDTYRREPSEYDRDQRSRHRGCS